MFGIIARPSGSVLHVHFHDRDVPGLRFSGSFVIRGGR